MKKHLVKTFSSCDTFQIDSFVRKKEAEGWELITPIQIIPSRQTGPHSSENGWIILTFEKEV